MTKRALFGLVLVALVLITADAALAQCPTSGSCHAGPQALASSGVGCGFCLQCPFSMGFCNLRIEGSSQATLGVYDVQFGNPRFSGSCLVVACLQGVVPIWPPVATASLYGSIFPSVQNLLLAARAANLGAALITLPLWSRFLARRALGLPWNVTPCAVVPLGWPKGRYGPTRRRPVEDVVSLDRYGNRAFRR